MFTAVYFGVLAVALLLAVERTRKATLAIIFGGIAATVYFLLGWGLV